MRLLAKLMKQRDMINKDIANMKSLWEKRKPALILFKHINHPVFDDFIKEIKVLLKKKTEVDILIKLQKQAIETKQTDSRLIDGLAKFEFRSASPSIKIQNRKKLVCQDRQSRSPYLNSSNKYFSEQTRFLREHPHDPSAQEEVLKASDELLADFDSDDLAFHMEFSASP